MEESEEEDVGRRGRGRARGRGRGRARGRGQQRGGRGRGRRGGRGRGQLVEEEQSAENVANHEQQLVVRELNVSLSITSLQVYGEDKLNYWQCTDEPESCMTK